MLSETLLDLLNTPLGISLATGTFTGAFIAASGLYLFGADNKKKVRDAVIAGIGTGILTTGLMLYKNYKINNLENSQQVSSEIYNQQIQHVPKMDDAYLTKHNIKLS